MGSMAGRKTVVASLVIIKCRNTEDGYTTTHNDSYTRSWKQTVELLIFKHFYKNVSQYLALIEVARETR